MKLAVVKRPEEVPGDYNYFLLPLALTSEEQEAFYRSVGYYIIEVSDEKGADLIAKSRKYLLHQIEVGKLTEEQNK